MNLKKMWIFIITLVVLLVSLNLNAVAANSVISIYVSASGSDTGDGTIEAPFKTINKAQSKIRDMKVAGSINSDVVVYFREGTYPIMQGLTFKSQDYVDGYTITYRNYSLEKVIFDGGASISKDKITKVTDSNILNRLPDESKNYVYEIDLSSFATTYTADKIVENIYEVTCNDEILKQAVYPNNGYLYVENILQKGTLDTAGAKWTCSDPILSKLQSDPNVCVAGSFLYEWWWWINSVKQINAVDKTIETNKPFNYDTTVGLMNKAPFYFTNSLSLMDQQGESFFDTQTKKLYFYPTGEINTDNYKLIALEDNMITFTNVKNITFKNITFQNGRKNCFYSSGCTNVNFDGCTVENFANSGLDFWSSKNCSIKNSEIYNIGTCAVNVHGGNLLTMESSGFELVNNEIHKTGRFNKNHAAGIWIHGYDGGTGAYIAHNKFYDMPQMAFCLKHETIAEYNEIFDVCKESGDMGAIYTGGSYYERGKVIRYNYIHDIPCNFKYSGYGTNGIYLDGGFGYDVYNNVVSNVSRNPYYSSEGGYKSVHDNVFIGNEKSALYETQPTSTQTIRVKGYNSNKPSSEVIAQIPSFTYTDALWLSKYPEIKNELDGGQPFLPSHKIYRNILYNCSEMSIADEAALSSYTSISANWINRVNPGFLDIRNKNFQLKYQAQVYCTLKDFQKFSMEKIGTIDKQLKNRFFYTTMLSKDSTLYYKNGEIKSFGSVPFFEEAGESYVSKEFIDTLTSKGTAVTGDKCKVSEISNYVYENILIKDNVLLISNSDHLELSDVEDARLIDYINSLLSNK